MEQSQQVLEWQEPAFKKGELKGEAKARAEERAESVLRLARKTFTEPIPAPLAAAIRACTDLEKLDRWLDALETAASLHEFQELVES